jgi:HEAT repeat protein
MVMIGCTQLKADKIFVPREKWDIPAAIEQARKGEPKEILITTRAIEEGTCPLPPKHEMKNYREMLKDESVFVQHLAVQVLASAKDKDNAEPLRHAIVDLQRKCANPEKYSQMELAALGIALSRAISALSQVDDESSVSVVFLSTLLKNDQSMEFGGGVAHAALARKGRPGLQALLESATQPITDKQKWFLESALGEINDPKLAVDLYACCKDKKYHDAVRSSCIRAVARMSQQSSEAEALLLGMAKDEKFDKRKDAIGQLGGTTQKAKELLLELERTGEGDARLVERELIQSEFDQRITNLVERIVMGKISKEEKKRLWNNVSVKTDERLRPHEQLLTQCLQVVDDEDRPFDNLRLQVWCRLFKLSNKLYTVEFEGKHENKLNANIEEIAYEIERETRRKQGFTPDKKKYGSNPYEGMKKEANEEARKLVKKRVSPKETKGVVP